MDAHCTADRPTHHPALHAVATENPPPAICSLTVAHPAHDTVTRVLLALRRPGVTVVGFAYDDGPDGAVCTLTTAAPLPAAVVARLRRLVGVLGVEVPDVLAPGWTVEGWEVRQTPSVCEALLRLRGPQGRRLVLAEGSSSGAALGNAYTKAAAEPAAEPLSA